MNIIFKIKFLYKSDESYMNTTRKKLIFLNIKFKRERQGEKMIEIEFQLWKKNSPCAV